MTARINQITRAVAQQFSAIEAQIFDSEMFAQWQGQLEVRQVNVRKDNADIKCDLDVRLMHWPETVHVKLYKHKALAVLPCVKDEAVAREHLQQQPMPAKFWKECFYFSRRTDLDDARYVLRDGNEMTLADAQQCLVMLKDFMVEIEAILAD